MFQTHVKTVYTHRGNVLNPLMWVPLKTFSHIQILFPKLLVLIIEIVMKMSLKG